jgi:signal transduction histidine kinase
VADSGKQNRKGRAPSRFAILREAIAKTSDVPGMTIQGQLVSLVAALVLSATVAVAIAIGYDHARDRERIEAITTDAARALARTIDRELTRGQNALQLLAQSWCLAADDIACFNQEAREALKFLPGDIIVLADASGRQLINTRLSFGEPLPVRLRQDELRRVFETGQPAISDLFIGALGRPLVSIDVPVRIADQTTYDLALGFYPDRLGAILKEHHLPPGWVASIYDTRGTTVARTRDADRYVGQPGPGALVQHMSQLPEGRVEIGSPDGDREVAVFSRSTESGWSVAIGSPRTGVVGYLSERLAWVIVVALVVLLSGTALAQVLGSRIARSIRCLVPPAKAVGRGEAAVVPPLPLVEADEVGRALQHASEMLRERQKVLATVAHDLRNPINAISLDATVVRLKAARLPGGEEVSKAAVSLADSARRMSGMVEDLLAVAVMTAGERSMLNTAQVEVSSLLGRAADASQPLFERAGLALEIETPGSLPKIDADPDRILRVFVNLLDNALKFTERSGRVVLRAHPQPDGVRFCVANTGPALSPEEMGSLFQPFWQAGREDRRGAGLGLSICHSIVEAHGGRIWAEPEPGMRVCICLVLPTASHAPSS